MVTVGRIRSLLECFGNRRAGRSLATIHHDGKKFTAQGHFAEAERSYLIALGEAQRFEERDPRLLGTLNELASFYQGQSKYPGAETFYGRALEILQVTRGREDRDVAITLNNLAGLAYDQGQYSRAEELFQRAISIFERDLGAVPGEFQICRHHPGVQDECRNPSIC